MSHSAARLRLRHSPAITVAAIVVMIAGLSIASWAVYLLPLLVIPLAVAVWSWRAGTDCDRDGLTVRAAVGRRRVPWSEITEITVDAQGRVVAHLRSGSLLPLPAASRTDLPRIVTISTGWADHDSSRSRASSRD